MGLMDRLRKGTVEVAEETEKAARIGRLKTETSGFNEQEAQTFREIGQRVIAVYAEGWEKIQLLDAEIARQEKEIEETKAGEII